MEDKFEKKLKSFLPYIIIIGVVYLIVPALLFINSDAVAYIILIGLLPLTALLCCAHYSMKKENDFFLSLVAPVFFLPAMFIYPIARESLLKAIIYLIAYFLCGYLGLTIGDILANRGKKKKPAEKAERPARPERGEPKTRRVEPIEDEYELEEEPVQRVERKAATAARPRRVAVETEKHETFRAADPYEDRSLDTSTTEDDIDAILREIHQRRSGE